MNEPQSIDSVLEAFASYIRSMGFTSPPRNSLSKDEAKAAIEAMVREIIGEDYPTTPYSPDGHDENSLLAKQRLRASKYNLKLEKE